MSRLNRLIALGGLLALAGCGTVMVDDTPPPRADYFTGDFAYATNRGAIYTEVVGNPFNAPEPAFHNRVFANMQGQNREKPAHFVPVHTKQTLAPFKVVAAFDMPSGVPAEELCQGRGALPPSLVGGGRVSLDMAFCIGDHLKSDASGWVSGVRGPGDPRFAELVREVTGAMIPQTDGLETGDDGNDNVP